MAKIKLTLPGLEIPVNGKQVSFTAPCSCSAVDGIQIDGVDYDLVDSAGNVVPFGRFVWCEGAVLTVTLDVTNRKAYLQNQNAYTRYEALTPATAELFGLGAGAVPNDVFAFLGKYNLHWWKMRGYGAHYEAFVQVDEEIFKFSVSQSAGNDFYYSDAITISQTDGKIALVSPQMIHVEWGQVPYDKIIGKYVGVSAHQNLDTVYKFDTDVTFDSVGSGGQLVTTFTGGTQTIISIYTEETGEWKFVFSNNSEAYPHSGVVDGFEYQYLGVPFDNAVTAPKIATGSYTGTGTYGASNPNSLTFEFAPKIVLLYAGEAASLFGETHRLLPYTLLWGCTTRFGYDNNSANINNCTYSGNTMSWYCTGGAAQQQNTSGGTFRYVAIG